MELQDGIHILTELLSSGEGWDSGMNDSLQGLGWEMETFAHYTCSN